MLLPKRLPRYYGRVAVRRNFSTQSALLAAKRRRAEDEIHRPSLSGSSVGHLFSEINAMRPGMEALRPDGQTMTEEQRTFARRTATWLMGVPVALGALIVGGSWIMRDAEDGK